jgi:hypothetical protein
VCESASARQVGRQLGLAASTVRAIDLRYLTRWAAQRRRPALKQMGVDEIWLGKRTKFLTVVSNLESGEPVWFGRDRLQTTLARSFARSCPGASGRGSTPPAWICGKPSRIASTRGRLAVGLSTTNFM